MKLSILAGATSQSINVFIRDSSSTTGGGLTGLTYNSAGLTAYYSHAGAYATATSITLATLAAVNSAYSSGGFRELDATNMPGWYRFDLPNAVIAGSKGRSVAVHLKGATNMAPLPIEIELTAWDNQDAVRGGLTAIPNVASGSAGGLIIQGTGTTGLNVSGGKAPATVAAGDMANNCITSSVLATDCIGAAQLATDAIGSAEIAASAVTKIQAGLATPTNITSASGISIATGGITAASFAAGAIDAAAIATDAIGSAEIAASAVTEIQSGLALASDLAVVASYIDTEVAAIKAKTDNLPASPAAVSDIPTAAQNAAALLDLSNGVETSITPRQALRLILAASAGKLSGAATTTITIRNVGDTKNRITATVDSDGNRSAVTTDAN